MVLGGAVTIIGAAKVPELTAGVVFYGIPPEQAAKPSDIRIPLQAHFANKDDWCTPQVVDAFESGMKAAGKSLEIFRYDAEHAFVNEQRQSVHDRQAAELAWAGRRNFSGSISAEINVDEGRMVGRRSEIFCTGASGYIGGSVAAYLVAAGHQVTGLVRSPEKADAVRARGIQPLLGTLDDGERLKKAAQAADIVVNAASADHKGAVVAMLDALAGSGKPFIHTSGSSIVGTRSKGERSDAIFDEDTPITPSPARVARVALNEFILSHCDKGCRPVIICPSLIYGLGHSANPDSVQVPLLIKLARKRGNAPQPGLARTSGRTCISTIW